VLFALRKSFQKPAQKGAKTDEFGQFCAFFSPITRQNTPVFEDNAQFLTQQFFENESGFRNVGTTTAVYNVVN
jgi:hypothetical protein